ncbi:hypothetical protein AB6H27_22535, partial [Providencia huaxiensis]
MNIYHFLAIGCVVFNIALFFYYLYKISKDNESFISRPLLLIPLVLAAILYSQAVYYEEKVLLGEYYVKQCKLLESNISNGFLKSNTNKIECNGVFDNVSTSKYNNAIDAYNEKLNKQ